MERREFLAKAGMVSAWAMVSVSVAGCYDDDPAAPAEEVDAAGVVTGGGHGHGGAVVTAAQQQAAGAVNLTLTGGHTHTVELSAQQVGAIADGDQVVVQSSSDGGHTHTVTFN